MLMVVSESPESTAPNRLVEPMFGEPVTDGRRNVATTPESESQELRNREIDMAFQRSSSLPRLSVQEAPRSRSTVRHESGLRTAHVGRIERTARSARRPSRAVDAVPLLAGVSRCPH